VLFPWVALFHAGLFVYLILSYAGDEPITSPLWLQPVYMLLYCVSWLYVCDMKRWAAFVYIGLTSISIVLQLTMKAGYAKDMYTDLMFPVNILFCFFVLFYFKRFE
jgi:hypothetical protein